MRVFELAMELDLSHIFGLTALVHHHRHISFMELGHLLTRSGITYAIIIIIIIYLSWNLATC